MGAMKTSKKALSAKERVEMGNISSLLSAGQQRSLVKQLNKLRSSGGQTAINKVVRNFVKESGGFETQKKAKKGLNPSIQKKQGFAGAGGMRKGPAKKAGGGKIKKKK
jgi:hypothetical protein